jgi:hypothetical protein
VERRAQKQLALRLRRANLASNKTLDTFDFKADPALNRQHVLQLASCDLIRDHANLLICGKSGTGKTHLAQAFAHEACRQNLNVLFINTQKMLQHLLLVGLRAYWTDVTICVRICSSWMIWPQTLDWLRSRGSLRCDCRALDAALSPHQ